MFKIDVYNNDLENNNIGAIYYLQNFFNITFINVDSIATADTILLLPYQFMDNYIFDIIKKYKKLIIFDYHEQSSTEYIEQYILPNTLQFNGAKLWICNNPEMADIMNNVFGDKNWIKLPIDVHMYQFYFPFFINNAIRYPTYFDNLKFSLDRTYNLKTFLGKRKWERDLVYLLQSSILDKDELSLLNYAFTESQEEIDAIPRFKIKKILEDVGITEIDYNIKKNDRIIHNDYPHFTYELEDTKFFVILETKNNEYDKNKINHKQISLTEKSMLPVMYGNIFYDFSFNTPVSKYLHEIGYETFFENTNVLGLKEFYENIKTNSNDMFNDNTNIKKMKHNFDLSKKLFNTKDNLLIDYIEYFIKNN